MIILIDNKEIQLNPDLINLVSDGNFTSIKGTFRNSMTFTINCGEHNNNFI
jgi:hypothetical protein